MFASLVSRRKLAQNLVTAQDDDRGVMRASSEHRNTASGSHRQERIYVYVLDEVLFSFYFLQIDDFERNTCLETHSRDVLL